jgi:hypothetical protein
LPIEFLFFSGLTFNYKLSDIPKKRQEPTKKPASLRRLAGMLIMQPGCPLKAGPWLSVPTLRQVWPKKNMYHYVAHVLGTQYWMYRQEN